MKHFTIILLACAGQLPSFGQDLDKSGQLAIEHFYRQLRADANIDLRLTDAYSSTHNGVSHLYYIQQYKGVDVDGATYTVGVLDGEVLTAFDRTIPDFDKVITADRSDVEPGAALELALRDLGIITRTRPAELGKSASGAMQYEVGGVLHSAAQVRQMYVKLSDGAYELGWEVLVDPASAIGAWTYFLSAGSGAVIRRHSQTIHCTFDQNFLAPHHSCKHHQEAAIGEVKPMVGAGTDGAAYRVVALPFESINHGSRQMVVNPADPEASPNGWHDVDGLPGADTTVTYGVNAHAFIDRDGDDLPDYPGADGGPGLVFDFPAPISIQEPIDYQDASVTNSFYVTNYLHDFSYHYGFDEFSGNFQLVNSSGLGRAGDHVLVASQHGAGKAQPNLNNANFTTLPDGIHGRMRLYLWSGAAQDKLLRVDDPPSVRGTYTTSTTSTDWGRPITADPITGEVVLAEAATNRPSEGCGELIGDYSGKIVMIDRGSCEFGEKALYAQNAGAIGFIMCNFEEQLVIMGAGASGGSVNIPGVFLTNSDCIKLKAQLGNGLTVSLVDETQEPGPARRSGSFDNGILAHEYAHGISMRLTGGPTVANCLRDYDTDSDGTADRGEQMGEGWSDFFTLITTVKPNHTAELQRGIGTYGIGQDTTGRGLRPFPYTTDMNINPMTYDDIAYNSVPHGVGTVWCTMLWDMYWAFVDEYGFDPDLIGGSGGNNLAVQLVVDGLKMQPCEPGFVDGRDAILAADQALTGGENQRLIWEVFARRGLGYSADQGETNTQLDGTEAYDIDPLVVEELKLLKEVTPYIEAGDDIVVSLRVVNHTPAGISDLVLTDQIPDGASFVVGSESQSMTQQGDLLIFEIDQIAAGDTIDVQYSLLSSMSIVSEREFFDDMENGSANWAILQETGDVSWFLQEFIVYSGSAAWGVENSETETDVSIVTLADITVPLEQPVVRFFQNYNLEKFYDPGILQISIDNGFSWETIPEEKIIRNGYKGRVLFTVFALRDLRGWYGDSDGWIPTLVDLSTYTGKNALLRWRLGTDQAVGETGWFIDDVEVMDAKFYNSSACLTVTGEADICVEAPERGTLVATGTVTSTADVSDTQDLIVTAFPNPAQDVVNVAISSRQNSRVDMRLLDANGRRVWGSLTPNVQSVTQPIETSDLARGFYFLEVVTNADRSITKLILQ